MGDAIIENGEVQKWRIQGVHTAAHGYKSGYSYVVLA